MTYRGIIRDISKEDITVEPLSSSTGESGSCCGSGSCGQCGNERTLKPVRVFNREGFDLEKGDLVEFDLSPLTAFFSVLRILVLPPAIFAGLFFLSRGGIAIAAGGAAAIVLLNILFRKPIGRRETPSITAKVPVQTTLRINPFRYSDSG